MTCPYCGQAHGVVLRYGTVYYCFMCYHTFDRDDINE